MPFKARVFGNYASPCRWRRLCSPLGVPPDDDDDDVDTGRQCAKLTVDDDDDDDNDDDDDKYDQRHIYALRTGPPGTQWKILPFPAGPVRHWLEEPLPKQSLVHHGFLDWIRHRPIQTVHQTAPKHAMLRQKFKIFWKWDFSILTLSLHASLFGFQPQPPTLGFSPISKPKIPAASLGAAIQYRASSCRR